MNVDDLILVSIDDHVVEPPDMFLRHVEVPMAGAEEWGRDPAAFAEMRSGVYDVHEPVGR